MQAENNHYGEALRILRERADSDGLVVVPKRRKCAICGVFHDLAGFARVRYTGAVSGALDMVCAECGRIHAKALSELCRIVCVGCREVVHIQEPGRERCGFVWVPGRCYHVPACPVCTSNPAMHSSPIVEKIVFYKAMGIPYATS